MHEIKERPILFSAPMVRAILEGRKIVTRRAIKPSKRGHDIGFELHQQDDGTWQPMHTFDESCMDSLGTEHPIVCPYGKPGDRLWVRETWNLSDSCRPPIAEQHIYAADLNSDGARKWAATWRPSIHMPRRASRVLLEITDVRVEQLQDGEGETDFESRYVAEGINRIHHGDGQHHYHAFKSEPGPGNWNDPFDAWRELWVSVSGAESWNSNPWVWVVEFKRVAP